MARATQNRGSKGFRDALRRRSAGQSLIVTIIVLFVLLFLGGVFIALIANNLRNTRRGVRVSAANRFSEAGIKYLDEQLMTSIEGADWRPTPDCPAGIAPCVTIPENDPDYFWLKPLELNTTTGEYEGGYTRINFGGPNASQSNLGGRALVRVTYRPYRINATTGEYFDDKGIAFKSSELPDRTRRFIKLESVGRVGIVDPLDPTTYKNSEGKGLRRELVAYKSLGLTESLRFITDKDKRRPVATLGAPDPVQERAATTAGENTANYLYGGQEYDTTTGQFIPRGGFAPDGTRRADSTKAQILNRPIFNVYQGAIRSNTDLTFYGINYLALDPRRGDTVSVAGALRMNGLGDGTATLSATDPTKVYLVNTSFTLAPRVRELDGTTAAAKVSDLGGTTKAANVLPSGSASFSTFNGFVRDNPRGNETQDLPEADKNNNLRAVPRLEPPVIDATVGDNGLTRYRALTRDSAPLPTADTGTQTGTNPTDTNVAVNINARYAGSYGWGQNLYIPNAVDLPAFSETIANNTSSSQRAEWLSPRVGTAPGNNWRSDGVYTPPAVSIDLTPRWYSLTQSTTALGRSRPYLRRPDSGRNAVQSAPLGKIYRFTYDGAGGSALATAPIAGIDGVDPATTGITAPKFAGYPAVKIANGLYEGDLVIFAEGNIRIKGAIGGFDPETGQTFIRHLTVVSNGTIYIDGSVLRDNISPQMAAANATMAAAKGKSTIALLAKNYIAVNTTQFLASADNTKAARDGINNGFVKIEPNGTDQLTFSTTFAPVVTYDDATGLVNVGNVYNNATAAEDLNRVPPYITDTANAPLSLLLRHGAEGDNGTSVQLGINPKNPASGAGFLNYFNNWDTNNPADTRTTFAFGDSRGGKFFGDVFPLNNAVNVAYLYPTNQYPYTAPVAQIPTTGLSNFFEVRHGGVAPAGSPTPSNYLLSRLGIVPLDVRIEALMYAQEGSFFVIPGAYFNPDSGDTFTAFLKKSINDPANPSRDPLITAQFPFYGEPLDIRITMFGAITENLPAEIGDQGAWLQKWGWVPRYSGSTGLNTPNGAPTFHGSAYTAVNEVRDGVGNGINYVYDPRLAAPYDTAGAPLRINPNFAGATGNIVEPLPPMPRLPVAPGLLYYGERSLR